MVVPMADIASAFSGAAVVSLVRLLRRRGPTGPVCQCRHGYVFHDTETGRCHHVETRYENRYEIDRNDDGEPVRDNYNRVERTTRSVHVGDIACACQMYTRAQHPARWGSRRK